MGSIVARPREESPSKPTESVLEEKIGRPVTDHIESPSVVEPPLSAYENERGEPYSVKYFGIKGWGHLKGKLDVDQVRDKVGVIEAWVKREINERELEDSVKSFDSILKEIEEEIKVEKEEKLTHKLTRISKYIEILWKQAKKEAEREMLYDHRS